MQQQPANEISLETVVAKLVAAMGHDPLCLSCGHRRFDVNVVKLSPHPPNVPLAVSLVGGPYMPYLAMTCKRCGQMEEGDTVLWDKWYERQERANA